MARIIDQFGRKRRQKKRKDVDYNLLKQFFQKMFCCTWAVGCQRFVQYIIYICLVPRTVYFGWICMKNVWSTLNSLMCCQLAVYTMIFQNEHVEKSCRLPKVLKDVSSHVWFKNFHGICAKEWYAVFVTAWDSKKLEMDDDAYLSHCMNLLYEVSFSGNNLGISIVDC